jgi:hypothetical protein
MCGYLCVGCARRHAKVPYTRAHPIVAASSASVKGGVRFCPLHAGKVLRGVCTETECQKALICEDCLNFGDHHGHKPQLLVEYEASIADEMAERVEALHTQAEQTAQEMHEVEAVISSIREKHATMAAALEEKRSALIEAVNASINRMHDTLNLIYGTRQERLQMQHLALNSLRVGNEAMVAAARSQMVAQSWYQTAEMFDVLDLTPWGTSELTFELNSYDALLPTIAEAGRIHVGGRLGDIKNLHASCTQGETDTGEPVCNIVH